MVTSEQIVPLPYRYIQGLNLSFAGNKSLTLAPGQARDSTNQFDLVIPNAITIDATKEGVNGLEPDTALAGNLFYSIYVIGSSLGFATPAALIATFGTIPRLPEGYDLFSLVGVWNTDGAVNLFKLYQTGTGATRNYFYDTTQNVLTAGAATAFTPVDLFPRVPSIPNTSVTLKINYTPAVASNKLSLRVTGSASATGIVEQSGIVATEEQNGFATIFTKTSPIVDYKVVTGDAVNLYVYGFSIPLI